MNQVVVFRKAKGQKGVPTVRVGIKAAAMEAALKKAIFRYLKGEEKGIVLYAHRALTSAEEKNLRQLAEALLPRALKAFPVKLPVLGGVTLPWWANKKLAAIFPYQALDAFHAWWEGLLGLARERLAEEEARIFSRLQAAEEEAELKATWAHREDGYDPSREIARARHQAHQALRELAKQLPAAPRSLRAFERGLREGETWAWDRLLKLARGLGIEPHPDWVEVKRRDVLMAPALIAFWRKASAWSALADRLGTWKTRELRLAREIQKVARDNPDLSVEEVVEKAGGSLEDLPLAYAALGIETPFVEPAEEPFKTEGDPQREALYIEGRLVLGHPPSIEELEELAKDPAFIERVQSRYQELVEA